ELLRDLTTAAVEVVHDLLPVQPVGDRLADLRVVERLLRLVEPDVADVERRAVEDLQVVVALDRRDVLRLDEVVALDLARLERLETRRVVGDRPEDDLVELRLVAPVVVVAGDREAVTAGPRLELERPGADRVLRAERPGRAEYALVVDGA